MSDQTTPAPYAAWTPDAQFDTMTEDGITRLVHGFYDKIRANPDLGPIFESQIKDKWDEHLARMVDFWATMMFDDVFRYEGRPLGVHINMPGLEDHHFGIWLTLFRETATEVFTPDIAAHFIEWAERVAKSFRYGIALHKGEPLPT